MNESTSPQRNDRTTGLSSPQGPMSHVPISLLTSQSLTKNGTSDSEPANSTSARPSPTEDAPPVDGPPAYKLALPVYGFKDLMNLPDCKSLKEACRYFTGADYPAIEKGVKVIEKFIAEGPVRRDIIRRQIEKLQKMDSEWDEQTRSHENMVLYFKSWLADSKLWQ
jgi:hypothetical protein